MKRPIIIFLLFFVYNINCMAQQLQLKGPYFGQIKPESEAEIFAPGLISCQGRHEYDLCFSPSGKEFNFLTISENGEVSIFYCYRQLTEWEGPVIRNEYPRPWTDHKINIPFGYNAYLHNNRKIVLFNQEGEDGNNDIFFAYRIKKGDWSEPIPLGPEVNTPFSETHPTMSIDNKYLFFSRYNEQSEFSDIYWIRSDMILELYEKAREEFK
jgi:hypothetical protein